MYHYVEGEKAEALYGSSRTLREKAKMGLMVFAVVMAPFAYLFYNHRPVARHVPAAPYVWPAGCKDFVDIDSAGNRFYAHEVPQSCMDPEYYINDPGKYHLMGSGGGKFQNVIRNYYRVGLDAINIFCMRDGTCVVEHIEYSVFAEPYVWSFACPQAEYKQGDPISSGCEEKDYRVGSEDYQVDSADNPHDLPFYRVGNDILGLNCYDPGSYRCVVEKRFPNAFAEQDG